MNKPSAAPVVEVLLVEDDPGDVAMTREALGTSKWAINLNVVTNGEEALAYLRRQPPYKSAPRPRLVLLDLNLPRLSGQEVLAEVKSDPDLVLIPVVVLTTSKADEDIARSYRLHANAYVTKPIGFEAFVATVSDIDHFFLSVAQAPPA